MAKLNLGCGQNLMEGYINVDKFDSFSPEVVWDLEATPWPFESNFADEIMMYHVLEHLGAQTDVFFNVMKELYRVCAPNGIVRIAVPHPRSDGFTGDPTHVRPITEQVLSLFSKANNREWKELGWPNTPLGIYLDIDFEIVNATINLMPHWWQKFQDGQLSNEEFEFAKQTYFNVVSEIKLDLRAVK
ncbi:MAG TPA: methyltransferase domain-containing protein [Burkholderiaceae bacterium]